VQCTGSIFEGEGGQRYAKLVEGLVAGAARGVGECDEGVSHLTAIDSGRCIELMDRTNSD